ncbi:MAG: iron-containing alcohol dehydrogenase, partial [Pygmaiobacter sp.]
DAYCRVPEICAEYGKSVVIIGGRTALLKAHSRILAALAFSKLRVLDTLWYGGDCTEETIKKLTKQSAVKRADMIFAVGGGRAIDTCKAVADKLEKPLFAFPTIASNGAAGTAVSVVRTAAGEVRELYFSKKPAVHVFVQTNLIAEAPRSFLWAALCAAERKSAQRSAVVGGQELFCFGVRTPLEQYGEKALEDCDHNLATEAVRALALAIVSGTVGKGESAAVYEKQHAQVYAII